MYFNRKKIIKLIFISLLCPILIFGQGKTQTIEQEKSFQQLHEIYKTNQKIKQLLIEKEKNEKIILHQRMIIGFTTLLLLFFFALSIYVYNQNNRLKKKCKEIKKLNTELITQCNELYSRTNNIQNFGSRYDTLKPLNLTSLRHILLNPNMKNRNYKIKVRPQLPIN